MQRKPISIVRRLFMYLALMYMITAVGVGVYVYMRQRVINMEVISRRLRLLNEYTNEKIALYPNFGWLQDSGVKYIIGQGMRICVIGFDGVPMYDSAPPDPMAYVNYSERPEFIATLKDGHSYVRHPDSQTGIMTLYVAMRYPQYVIRLSMRWTEDMDDMLRPSNMWMVVYLLLIAGLGIVMYRLTKAMRASVQRIKDVTEKLAKHEEISVSDKRPVRFELDAVTDQIITIYQDLNRATEKLSIERERITSCLYIANSGLGIFGEDGEDILYNSVFVQYLDIICEKRVSVQDNIMDIPEMKELTTFVKTMQQKPMDARKQYMKYIKTNGRIFLLRAYLFQDNSFGVSIRDMTEIEGERQNRRELMQNINHELKTPVSSIQAYLETILENSHIDDERRTAFLRRCFDQSTRLANLLKDISMLTRMEEAPGMYEMELVDVNEIIDTILNDLQLKLNENHDTAYNQVPKNLTIKGNQMLVYSIFRNLIDNSIAYAGSHIKIFIQCIREDDRYYYFSYADTGIGVSDEHLQRLFDRFYRVNKGRSRKMGGTGLGLAIVRNAIIIHGGNIYAKHFSGGGLEFVFTLTKGF